jgi:hypothetical protein
MASSATYSQVAKLEPATSKMLHGDRNVRVNRSKEQPCVMKAVFMQRTRLFYALLGAGESEYTQTSPSFAFLVINYLCGDACSAHKAQLPRLLVHTAIAASQS